MSSKTKFGMVIDIRRCVGCMSCSVSCKMENSVPFGVFRSNVDIIEKGTFPNVKRHFFPKLCNQCEDAPCVSVCPVGATFKREDGIIDVDEKKCIACGYCVVGCPYEARYLHPEKKVVDKCDFCQHLIDEGGIPTCVRNCMGKARIFGDLNDPNSPVSKLIVEEAVMTRKASLGTKPSVFYIEADKNQVDK